MAREIVPFIPDNGRWLAPLGGLVAEVTGSELRIYQQNGDGVARFPLAPMLDTEAMTLGTWRIEQGMLTANLTDRPTVQVRLWTARGRVHYSIYCPLPSPLDIAYFPNTTFRGPHWRTFVPPDDDREWPREAAHDVPVATGTSAMAEEIRGLAHTGVFTPPPRACALQYDDGWLSVVIPGTLPVATVTFAVDSQQQFRLTFHHYTQAHAGDMGPEVVIMGGLAEPYQALDELAIAASEMHTVQPLRIPADWWPTPQVRLPANRLLGEQALLLRARLGTPFNIVLGGWYQAAGDYTAHHATFGDDAGLRAVIDALHAGGHHIILRVSPFALARQATVTQQYADGVLRDREGNMATHANTLLLRDVTFPAMREQLCVVVQRLVSPAGLDADGLQVDDLDACPDPRTTHPYNPAWGIGDELGWKVITLITDAAREVKSDAFISGTAVMPYAQAQQCAIRLGDGAGHALTPWWRRARIVSRALPGMLIETSARPLYREEAAVHWVTAPVYGIPTLAHFEQFDGASPLRDEEYGLLAACWHVYANAPGWTDQRVLIEPDEAIFERYNSDGSLAAQCLERTVLLTVSPHEIRACAHTTHHIELPLSDDRQVVEAWTSTLMGDAMPLELGDAGARPLTVTVPAAGAQGTYLRIMTV